MVTYKKLTYDGSKIQVESAIRDGEGRVISTNYIRKESYWGFEFELDASDTGSQVVALSNIPSGTTPRMVQIFKKNTDIYELIQTDATLSVSDNVWSCTLNKPTNSGVWAVRVFGWA